jgi:transposase InsO family protein
VDRFKSEFSVNLACALLCLPRSSYYYQAQRISLTDKYAYLKPDLEAVIDKNPKYGYRRLHDALKNEQRRLINHKPLKKLLKEWDLALKRTVRRPKPSGLQTALVEMDSRANLLMSLSADEIEPLTLYQTDFSEIAAACGSVQLIPYLDYQSKIVAGAHVGLHKDAAAALAAYQELKKFLKEHGIDPDEIIIHQDQGSPFTSYEYVGTLVSDDVTLSFSRVGRPGDNPGMESFFGRLKAEWADMFATARDIDELIALVWEAIRYYNYDRIHSKTNGTSPMKNLPTILA